MHKRVLLLLCAASLALGAGARAATPTSPGTWTLTPAVVSQYLFRGVRLSGPAFQPSLEYVNGSWLAGVWASVPLDETVPGQSDPEFDFYGSYSVALSDAVSLVAGLTVYTYPDADRNAGFYRSTVEPSVALNYTVAGLRLTPKVYYDAVLEGATYELAAFYAVPLTTLGTELDFSATIGTFEWKDAVENASPRVKNRGDYWQAGVALPFQITATQRVTVGWYYAKGDENFLKQGTAPKVANGGAVGRGVGVISYAIAF